MNTFCKHSAALVAWLVAVGWGCWPAPSRAQFLPLGTAPTASQPNLAPPPVAPPAAQPTAPPPGAQVPVGFAAPAAAEPPLTAVPPPSLSRPLVGPEPAGAEQPGEEEPLSDAELICVVGSEHILAGDMRIIYEPHMEEYIGRISASQEQMIRRRYTREALKGYVGIKALYLEFFRENAGTGGPAEMKETRDKIETRANKVFYEEQVPNLLKTHKVPDLRALEEKLRTKSMSVNQVRMQFVERVLASEIERRHVPKHVEIGRDELLKYYEDHTQEWNKPGRAKWRQLTARFDRFPTKEAARAAIETMGNEVYLGGKRFEAVAREHSQGFTADEGGLVDWTTQGALKSTKLDAAIFSIPRMRLSKVIEDETGFHIIEVLEREEPSRVSFEAAQEQMRKEITKTKIDEVRQAYHKKVMDRTVIWTRWPEDIPGSRSLIEVLEDSPLTLSNPSR